MSTKPIRRLTDLVGVLNRGRFAEKCDEQPMAFGDRRLQRYDRFDLNNWIDSRKTRARGGVKFMADAIAKF